jgi:hypothetical protein
MISLLFTGIPSMEIRFRSEKPDLVKIVSEAESRSKDTGVSIVRFDQQLSSDELGILVRKSLEWKC